MRRHRLFGLLAVTAMLAGLMPVTPAGAVETAPAPTTNCPDGQHFVNSTGGVVALPVLDGYDYAVTVSGTFAAGGNDIRADAEYSQDQYQRDNDLPWTDFVRDYEAYGETLLELMVDGLAIEWGDFSASHIYSPVIAATASTMDFEIYDTYPSNNTGGLCVGLDRIPQGEITMPDPGQVIFGDLYLGATYDDDDPTGVDWAVRAGTCSPGTNVAGNVGGYSTPYTFDGATFASGPIDTSSWAAGMYCFVFNPREAGLEPNLRLVREFYIADGHINGGGQIIEAIDPDAKRIDYYKVSFGGWLYRMGTAAPFCEWAVTFHNVSVDDLDKGKFKGTSCTVPGAFNSGAADGVTNFAVYGTFNGVTGHTLVVRMEDNTEPGNLDTIRFELFDDGGATITPANSLTAAAIYDTSDKKPAIHAGGDFTSISTNNGNARTELDRGNLQIDLP